MDIQHRRRHCLCRSLESLLIAATLLSTACSEGGTSGGDDELEADSDSAGADDDDDDDAVDAGRSNGRDASKGTAKPDASKDAGVMDAKTSDAQQSSEDGSAPSNRSDASTDGGPRSVDASTPDGTKMDLGKGDGHDVITIGDSWMSLFPGFQGIQESLVSASGQRYRTYAAPGTQVLNEQIPGQYETAKRENPDIKTVVMTGGGNDILLTNLADACAQFTQACRDQQHKISERVFALIAEMAKDGVKDLVTIGYSRGDGQYDASIDYTIETFWKPELCPEGMRCHYLDSDEIIHGMLSDGVHPTAAGCDSIAEEVVRMMETEGMRR